MLMAKENKKGQGIVGVWNGVEQGLFMEVVEGGEWEEEAMGSKSNSKKRLRVGGEGSAVANIQNVKKMK